jgi:hypothetical protein
VFVATRPKPRAITRHSRPHAESGELVQTPNLGRSRTLSRRTLQSVGFILRQKSPNAGLKNAGSYTAAMELRAAMLFVRSFRPDWHHVTDVTMCRVVAKRLDGLNSRALRPIPGACLICNKIAAFQGCTWSQSHRKMHPLEKIILDSWRIAAGSVPDSQAA